MNSLHLKAEYFNCYSDGSKCVAAQLPLITPNFPEISDCYAGTINIKLEEPLIVVSPDHRTAPIKWDESLSDGEIIDIVRVGLEIPYGGHAYDAWLYVAHLSAHRSDLTKHELIAPHLPLNSHTELGIIIKRPVTTLAYKYGSVHVVV